MSRAERIENLVAAMRDNPRSVRFSDALKVCAHYFGAARISASHHVFKTPWPGDPRVNLQSGKDGNAKPYQVRQIVLAIDRLAFLKGSK
jgi:hypothetical protein